MKVELDNLSVKYLADLRRALRNPEVIKNVSYNVPTYFLKSLKEILIKKDAYKFAIIVNKKFAGIVVLENPNKEKTSYECGYFVAREFWGKGIATSAVKEIVRQGFNNFKIKKVWAITSMKNPASGKVLKKARFRLIKRDNKNKEFLWEKTKWQ